MVQEPLEIDKIGAEIKSLQYLEGSRPAEAQGVRKTVFRKYPLKQRVIGGLCRTQDIVPSVLWVRARLSVFPESVCCCLFVGFLRI